MSKNTNICNENQASNSPPISEIKLINLLGAILFMIRHLMYCKIIIIGYNK